eukprot:1393898-Amorphochlora_amoeboformis.AAC.2
MLDGHANNDNFINFDLVFVFILVIEEWSRYPRAPGPRVIRLDYNGDSREYSYWTLLDCILHGNFIMLFMV